jgi:preprotein translocase subunit YajC
VEQYGSLMLFAGMLLVFWLLLIRPAQRRNKALSQMQAELAVGDRVMLGSGLYGTITALAHDRVHLSIAADTIVEVALGAVARVENDSPDGSGVRAGLADPDAAGQESSPPTTNGES